MKKVIITIGIRPDIIRLSEIIKALKKVCKVMIVDSGQHYSNNLSSVFYKQFKLPKPVILRYNKKIEGWAGKMANVQKNFEDILLKMSEKPDHVIVLGDNASSAGFVLGAKMLNLNVIHLEAGHRSYNNIMPEEKFRKICDALADLHLCYTEQSRQILLREGVHPRKIMVVGNPIFEVCEEWSDKTDPVDEEDYILVTCHRSENMDNLENVKSLFCALNKIKQDKKIIVMPRMKKHITYDNNITVFEYLDPVGFVEFQKLLRGAKLVITDSGSVVEEAWFWNKPCITIRDRTERWELLEDGCNIITGCATEQIINATNYLLQRKYDEEFEPTYNCSIVSEKIVSIILSNVAGEAGKIE